VGKGNVAHHGQAAKLCKTTSASDEEILMWALETVALGLPGDGPIRSSHHQASKPSHITEGVDNNVMGVLPACLAPAIVLTAAMEVVPMSVKGSLARAAVTQGAGSHQVWVLHPSCRAENLLALELLEVSTGAPGERNMEKEIREDGLHLLAQPGVYEGPGAPAGLQGAPPHQHRQPAETGSWS
jgi:hypothetical protein